MAYIEMHRDNLKNNFNYLNNLFDKNDIEWGVVSKLLCGNKIYIQELLDLGVREFHDSRISNLKTIKQMDPDVQTVYIKPAAKRSIKSMVRWADVSFNTEYSTIKMISDEAVRQEKEHKIIIMVEMGDLREGVLGDRLLDFYERIFELPNLEVIGLGANLNCLNGVMPTHDKLIQLSLYKQLIESRFNKKIRWVSGGSSVTIPMIFKKLVPKGVNHFRVGETLYNGKDLITEKVIKGMKGDVFKLYAEIIELTKKPKVPIGEFGTNVAGETPEINEDDYGKSSYRAILDIGLLDIDTNYIQPIRKNWSIEGASSDMIVIDLGENKEKKKVGDLISFKMDYMGILTVLNSDYIRKVVV